MARHEVVSTDVVATGTLRVHYVREILALRQRESLNVQLEDPCPTAYLARCLAPKRAVGMAYVVSLETGRSMIDNRLPH